MTRCFGLSMLIFRINGDQASDFSNLRQNGLIRITFRSTKCQAD